MEIAFCLPFKVRQNLSGAASRNSRFFGNIRCGICNICFKLISLNSQMKILSNDINHNVNLNFQ